MTVLLLLTSTVPATTNVFYGKSLKMDVRISKPDVPKVKLEPKPFLKE